MHGNRGGGKLALCGFIAASLGYACGEAANPAPDNSGAAQKSVPLDTPAKGPMSLRQWSRNEANASLAERASVRIRENRIGYLIEALQGGLAVASSESAREDTLRAFLAEYAVLLRSPNEGVPTHPVVLKPSGAPIPFRVAGAEGVYMAFTQHVDSFVVYRGLVGGRFVGNVLARPSQAVERGRGEAS